MAESRCPARHAPAVELQRLDAGGFCVELMRFDAGGLLCGAERFAMQGVGSVCGADQCMRGVWRSELSVDVGGSGVELSVDGGGLGVHACRRWACPSG